MLPVFSSGISCPTLVLGTAPADATPETHLLAGPWCIASHPQAPGTPSLDTLFTMPPEPLADPNRLEQAASQARRLIADTLPLLAEHGNTLHQVNYSSRFWEFALVPWLVRLTEIVVDRLYRAEGILYCFGERTLTVPILPQCGDVAFPSPSPGASGFTFASTQDFIMGGMLHPNWNHWLLSRLLERSWPAAWHKQFLQPVMRRPPIQNETGFKHVLRNWIFRLPFPRIKGFTLGTSLLLSLDLIRNRHQKDLTIPLSQLGDANTPPLPLQWTTQDMVALALSLLPESLRENPSFPRLKGKSIVHTRVASVAACEDDAYRLQLALHREKNCRVIFIQHGGEYGYVRSSVAYPLVEYCQHSFITWGWKRHGTFQGHFVPLPHPQLAVLRHKHKETQRQLLFVGTEMALLPYTLKSMLRGRQMFSYREDKAHFLTALPSSLQKQVWYRPYFDIPSSLSDAPWLQERFPGIHRCVGPLEPHLLQCRLLVLDHAGTTLAQALAADIPLVLFWNRDTVQFTPEALPLLDILREGGILHDSPTEAAAQITSIWDDVPGWWAKARHYCAPWASSYALTVEEKTLPLWRKTLREI